MARHIFTQHDLEFIVSRGLALPTSAQILSQREYILITKGLSPNLVTEAVVRQAYLEHFWVYLTKGHIFDISNLVMEILEEDKTPPTFEPGDEEE